MRRKEWGKTKKNWRLGFWWFHEDLIIVWSQWHFWSPAIYHRRIFCAVSEILTEGYSVLSILSERFSKWYFTMRSGVLIKEIVFGLVLSYPNRTLTLWRVHFWTLRPTSTHSMSTLLCNYTVTPKKTQHLKKMAVFWLLAKGRPLNLSLWFFYTALVYDMQFDPKI